MPAKKATGRSYTPSPTVKGSKPGKTGGVWRDKNGKVIGTSAAEDSRVKPVKRRVKGLAPRRIS